APLSDAAKAEGVKVYHLNIGQPDLPSPVTALDAIRAIDRTTLEYSPSDGYRYYRENLTRYYKKYDIDLTPEQIIVTAGGSEAVLYAFMACLNPGDEIIVPEPAYANYMAFAISAGAIIRTIPSTMESGFALPPMDEFEKLINERTKGILICNPNNPTGYVYTPQEMEQIRCLVKKYNLYLFSDEVYREFIYNDTPYVSACHLKDVEENVVLIDSVSKRYSECGIRIGALITRNRKVHDTVMKFCQARLSPPLIGQIAANASLEVNGSYMQHNFDEYKGRRDFLIERLNQIPGVYSPMPQGAFYTLARLPIDDADVFCAWCLSHFRYEGQTIFMAPATGFYVTPGLGTNEVRIAYVLNREELDKALTVLEKALEAYPGRS
ncbi:MAG: pyridoxal phosphate-dependent aminotransferase, partial [Proteiniphilum sp.]|nr:pyridoxal phosphate-dependent aminotransferase [Proteiniphilum sp.]